MLSEVWGSQILSSCGPQALPVQYLEANQETELKLLSEE